MEVIDHLESPSFMEGGAEARLGWVEEYVGGDAFETVSIEYAFGKAECEVNREMGCCDKEMPRDEEMG